MIFPNPSWDAEQWMDYYRQLACGMAGAGADYDDDVYEVPIVGGPRLHTCPVCSDRTITVQWTDTPDVPCWSCGWVPAHA